MSSCTRYGSPDENSSLPVIFTENAANKVALIIAEENNPNLKLRLDIKGGGCSGLEYHFNLDENQREDDHITVTNGVMLLVDKNSFEYLAGASVDYTEDLEGACFTINNPNAAKTCGCGKSFDVPES